MQTGSQLTFARHHINRSLTVYQIWAQSVNPFSRSGCNPCTCARAAAPQTWHMEMHCLVDAFPHTKFHRNRPELLPRYCNCCKTDTPRFARGTCSRGYPHASGIVPIVGRRDEAILQKTPRVNRSNGCGDISFAKAWPRPAAHTQKFLLLYDETLIASFARNKVQLYVFISNKGIDLPKSDMLGIIAQNTHCYHGLKEPLRVVPHSSVPISHFAQHGNSVTFSKLLIKVMTRSCCTIQHG